MRRALSLVCALCGLLLAQRAQGAASCASLQIEGPAAGVGALKSALHAAGFEAKQVASDGDVQLAIREALRDCQVSLDVKLRFWSEEEPVTVAELALPKGTRGALSGVCSAPRPTAEHWRALAATAAAKTLERSEERIGGVILRSNPTPASLVIASGKEELRASTPFARGCLPLSGISGKVIFHDKRELAFDQPARVEPEPRTFVYPRDPPPEPEPNPDPDPKPNEPDAFRRAIDWLLEHIKWGSVLPLVVSFVFFWPLYSPRFAVAIRRAEFDADSVCTRLVISVTQANSRVRVTVEGRLDLWPPDGSTTAHEIEDLEPAQVALVELPKRDLEAWRLRESDELMARVTCKHGPRALRTFGSKSIRLRVQPP